MSFFSKILDKLGLGKGKDQPAASASTPAPVAGPPKPPAPAPVVKTAAPASAAAKPAAPAASAPVARPASTTEKNQKDDMVIKQEPVVAVAPAPKPISEVDVVKQLEQKAKGTGLNWKQSISDLLFLLDLDNSREARNELAKELGCPPELMSDSAKMNTWLHKTVLKKIAENGGNIPQDLLD